MPVVKQKAETTSSEPRESPERGSAGTALTDDEARRTVQQLIDFALPRIPREFEGEKHWGDTKKLWAGVKLRRDGFKLSTKRRWKDVRHGRWTKYRVTLPGRKDAPPPLKIHVQSVQPHIKNGSVSGVVMNMNLETPLDFSARIQRWNLGLQWYSIEISGHLTARMTMTSTLSTYPDYSEIPPAIIVDPSVQSAHLALHDFHVDRVSKIGGDVAEQWGEVAHKVAEEIFIEDLNEKLAGKINKAIDKNRDDLRWSTSDWISQWVGKASEEKSNH